MHSKFVIASLISLIPFVAGHSSITNAVGSGGNAGAAFGVTGGTPNIQQVTRLDNSCGSLVTGTKNNVAQGISAAVAKNALPSVSAGGKLTMTVHQFNADGAGPFFCSVDTTGTGSNFQSIQVATNVPGNNGVSGASNKDFPLVASLPANLACTGKSGSASGICLVRCGNKQNGGFGGCVPVQQAGAAAGKASGTAIATGANTGAGKANTGAEKANGSNASTKGAGKGGKKNGGKKHNKGNRKGGRSVAESVEDIRGKLRFFRA